MTTRGIDVSHWQGNVDWFQVAQSDVKFAFAKATDSSTGVDAQFSTNWGQIQQAGLFRGAYHYGHPGRDAETQAAHFSSVVGPLGFRDLPPVLDLEEADGQSAEQVLNWARAFVTKAETLFGRSVVVYTGGFWREALKNIDDPFFRKRSLWLAAYRAQPVVPGSWSEWTFWQYTEGAHNGPVAVPGVRPCDQDLFKGSEADLDLLCRGDAPAVEQPPALGPDKAFPGTQFVWPRTPAVAGPAVKEWQQRMVARGFKMDADGVYGPESKAACAAFQRDHGLVPDGIVGPRTWAAIFAA